VSLVRRIGNLYLGDSNIAQYQQKAGIVGLDVGRYLRRLGEVRMGLIAGREQSDLDIGLPFLPNEKFSIGAWTARVDIDRLDNNNFPNEGQRARLDVVGSRAGLGADSTYTRVQFDWTGARTWRNNTFSANLSVGRDVGSGQAPLFDSFTLGGFQRLSGYPLNRFRAQGVTFGSLGYRRVVQPPLGLELGGILDRMYAGASLEAARLYDSVDPLTPDGDYYSGSIYIGADTLIGPMFMGIGYAGGSNYQLWIAVGRPWMPR
jgi:NTE family protein